MKKGGEGEKKKASKPKKKASKPKKKADTAETLDDAADQGTQGDDEATPAPKRKRKRAENAESSKKISRKRTKKSDGAAAKPSAAVESAMVAASMNGHSEETDEDAGAVYLDVNMWKTQREALDGSFKSARENMLARGPWQMPKAVGAATKFKAVAKQTLQKMGRFDVHDLFKEKVTDEEAEGYSELISNPMDFGTMRQKVDSGVYGTGNAAVAMLYNDFLLVFENCALYNGDDGEVGLEAARLLGLLPETFAGACAAAAAKKQSKSKKATSDA
jgi:hypothetical protein